MWKLIEKRITFKIKTGYYIELLTPGIMKLLGSTENEITKNKSIIMMIIIIRWYNQEDLLVDFLVLY